MGSASTSIYLLIQTMHTAITLIKCEEYMSIFERLLDNSDKILDRIQAAEYLGVDPHTLQIWAHKKKHIPYYKIGRLAKYKLSDLQKFVNKSKQEVTCDSANG